MPFMEMHEQNYLGFCRSKDQKSSGSLDTLRRIVSAMTAPYLFGIVIKALETHIKGLTVKGEIQASRQTWNHVGAFISCI